MYSAAIAAHSVFNNELLTYCIVIIAGELCLRFLANLSPPNRQRHPPGCRLPPNPSRFRLFVNLQSSYSLSSSGRRPIPAPNASTRARRRARLHWRATLFSPTQQSPRRRAAGRTLRRRDRAPTSGAASVPESTRSTRWLKRTPPPSLPSCSARPVADQPTTTVSQTVPSQSYCR